MPARRLAVLLALLAACGSPSSGDRPSTTAQPTTLPASPTQDRIGAAIEEFCLDMERFGSGVVDTSNAGETIGSTLDTLQGWLTGDADRLEEAGGPVGTVKLVRGIAQAAETEAARVRAAYPPGTSIEAAFEAYAEFGTWIDGQKARIPVATCPDLGRG